jgi:hypothetical protein
MLSPGRKPREPMMKPKAVYLNGKLVGTAGTWHEVATLVGKVLGRYLSMREIFRHGSEGPEGFYVEMQD